MGGKNFFSSGKIIQSKTEVWTFPRTIDMIFRQSKKDIRTPDTNIALLPVTGFSWGIHSCWFYYVPFASTCNFTVMKPNYLFHIQVTFELKQFVFHLLNIKTKYFDIPITLYLQTTSQRCSYVPYMIKIKCMP